MTGESAQHSWNPDLSLPPLELLLSVYSHRDVTMWLWVCGEQRDGFSPLAGEGTQKVLFMPGWGCALAVPPALWLCLCPVGPAQV